MSQITDASMREIIAQRLAAVHVEVADMSGEFSHTTGSPHDKSAKHHRQTSASLPNLSLIPCTLCQYLPSLKYEINLIANG